MVTLDPKLPHAWHNLAAVCQELGRWDEAATALRRAIDLAPADPEARFGLAAALVALGRERAAIKRLRELAKEPAHRLRALSRMAIIDASTVAGDEADEMSAAASNEAVPSETRIALWFALGGVREAQGRDTEAFDAFAAGNALKREALEGAPPGQRPQDILRDHAKAAEHVAKVMAAYVVRSEKPDAADIAPIFIIGMPRSGSSLIEQILASHRDVVGLGETAVLPQLLERAYPISAGQEFAPRLAEIRAAYLGALRDRGWDGRRRFVDKTLENFLHVGAIRRMFPRAIILESRRDPADICVGCWRQLFNRGSETLYDLREIAAEYAIFARLMNHWQSAGEGIVPVSLEELTSDPDRQIRTLVTEICGLLWDPATLRFWTAERAVQTASAVQVRRPPSISVHGRWRRYENQMQPLLEVLAPFRMHVP